MAQDVRIAVAGNWTSSKWERLKAYFIELTKQQYYRVYVRQINNAASPAFQVLVRITADAGGTLQTAYNAVQDFIVAGLFLDATNLSNFQQAKLIMGYDGIDLLKKDVMPLVVDINGDGSGSGEYNMLATKTSAYGYDLVITLAPNAHTMAQTIISLKSAMDTAMGMAHS